MYDKDWLNRLIAQWRSTTMTSARITERAAAEHEATTLLNSSAGQMSEDQARYFFKLVTRDWQDGVVRKDRFAMTYTGSLVNQMVARMDRFNEWTKRLWTTNDVPGALDDFWANPLPGAGISYPTLLLYLRHPDRYNIWLGALQDGLAVLGTTVTGDSKRAQYLNYNDAVNQIRVAHGIQVPETDIIFTRLGRIRDEMAKELETALKDLGLVTTGSAIKKRIKPEQGLSFDVQLETPGVPVRWIAGSRRRTGNTFLLHALVGRQQAERPVLKVRLKDLGYDTWLSDGADPATNVDFCDYHTLSGGHTPYHVALGDISLEEFTAGRIKERFQPLLDAVRETPDLLHEEEEEVEVDAGDSPAASAEASVYTLDEAAADTHLPAAYLQELLDLMSTTGRRQMVLYGPPGTGKTFVAKALAKVVTHGLTEVVTVQFHPSYSYEEFLEGIRPTTITANGRTDLVYELEDGIFKRFCNQAAKNPSKSYVMLIDEINRGNIPRIFGELLYLLEYRGESVTLPYSKQPFNIPPNVHLIATMNTADRSVALVDAALRRRFQFIPFFPDTEAGILRQWLKEYRLDMKYVADMVDRVNALIGDRASSIGHSFFMDKELDEKRLQRIWTYNIMPLLEEQFFDQPENLKACELDRLLAVYRPGKEASGDGTEAD